MVKPNYTINVGGELYEFDQPKVMGILNATPDSFYSGCRAQAEADIEARVLQIIDEGGDMIDVGAYSTRPGAADVSTTEEMERLRMALGVLRRLAPKAIVSVDTFRADVAKMCVEEYGVNIINDISAGDLDERMFEVVAQLGVPYLIMHMKGTPRTMQNDIVYEDLMKEILIYFSRKVDELHELGVKDIILDPGFGFGKTLAHNYELMAHLEEFHQFGLPLLVGISRKSMIYKLIGGGPADALGGTTMLNTIALSKGANILRVHDVKETFNVVKMFSELDRYDESIRK